MLPSAITTIPECTVSTPMFGNVNSIRRSVATTMFSTNVSRITRSGHHE